jgi:hypothetical protein
MALLYPPLVLMFFYGLIFSLIIYYNRKAKHPIIGLAGITVGSFAYAFIYKHHLLSFLPLEMFGAKFSEHLLLLIPMLLLIIIGFFVFFKRKKWLPASMIIFLFVGAYTFSETASSRSY